MADNETISYIPPDELWRRAAAVLHRKLPGLQAVSERADIASMVAESEAEAEAKARRHLGREIEILEAAILHFAHLSASLEVATRKAELAAPPEPGRRAIVFLVGTLCQHLVSVRRLVLSGLDSPARCVMRTAYEAACLAVVSANDPAFAKRYAAAVDGKDATKFWLRELGAGQLWAKFDAVARRLLGEAIGDKGIAEIADLRGNALDLGAGATHSSFVSTFLTAMVPCLEDGDRLNIGILGAASQESNGILASANRTAWIASRLLYVLLIRPCDGPAHQHVLDLNDEIDQAVELSYVVLGTLYIFNLPNEAEGVRGIRLMHSNTAAP